MDVADRLNQFFQAKNLTNYQAEKVCGLSNGYFRNMRKAPSEKILESILNTFPELNKEWLLSGNGEMINDGVEPIQAERKIDKERQERLLRIYGYAVEKGLCKGRMEFADLVSVAKPTMSKALAGDPVALTDSFLIKVNDALGNPFCLDYLIHGVEPIYRSEVGAQRAREERVDVFTSDVLRPAEDDGEGVPLLPITAVAGYNGIDAEGVRLEDCPRYVVPDFIQAKADFLIRVTGQSMQPMYLNGDLLACKFVRDASLFQWGRTYIIDTAEGAMLKQLFASADNKDAVTCRSVNPAYPPFDIQKSALRATAIIVGLIRMEDM